MKRSRSMALLLAMVLALPLTIAPAAAAGTSATPPEMVAAYNSLADTILGAKKTESGLVRAILAATYQHADAMMARAVTKMSSGQAATQEIETVAALVSQLGNEGDAAVAGIRKRLLEGGHHHNAAGEQQGIFDEGFVIVTRAARKSFLDAATAIGKMSASKDAAALKTAWAPVATQYASLMGGGR